MKKKLIGYRGVSNTKVLGERGTSNLMDRYAPKMAWAGQKIKENR